MVLSALFVTDLKGRIIDPLIDQVEAVAIIVRVGSEDDAGPEILQCADIDLSCLRRR